MGEGRSSKMQSFGRKRERLKGQGRLTWLLLLASYLAQVSSAEQPALARLSKLGQVQGLALEGGAAFLGLPYAAPPVGPLRFMPAGAPGGPQWAPLRDHSQFGPACVRLAEWPAHSQAEDCLSANLFVPRREEQDPPRPLVVLLHGSQTAGKANSLAHLALAGRLGAVLVTFNYRMGLLGFLPFAERAASQPRSNHAIWDHIGLLHWLKHNAAAFNADAQSVSLLAADNQAADMAKLLALSPLAKGLFHRLLLVQRDQAEPSQLDRWLAVARDARDARRRLLAALAQSVKLAPSQTQLDANERSLFDFIQFANLSQLADLDRQLRATLPEQPLQLAYGPNLDDRVLFPHLTALVRDGQLEFARPTWQNFSSTRAELNYCQYLRQLYALQPDPLALVSPRLPPIATSTASVQRGWHPSGASQPPARPRSSRRRLQAATFAHLRQVHLLGQFLGSQAETPEGSSSQLELSDSPAGEPAQELNQRTGRGLAEQATDTEQLMALLGSYDLMLGYRTSQSPSAKPKTSSQVATLAGNYSQIASYLVASAGPASEQFLAWLRLAELHSVSAISSNASALEAHCDFLPNDKSQPTDRRPRSFAFLDNQSHSSDPNRVQTQPDDWTSQVDASTMLGLANFVASGNPNSPGSLEWPVYDPMNRRFRLQTSAPLGVDLSKQAQVYLDLVPYLARWSSSKLANQEQVLQDLAACLSEINAALNRTDARIQQESGCIRGPVLQRLRVQLRQLSADELGHLFRLSRMQTPANSSSSSTITTRNLISNQSDVSLDASELQVLEDLTSNRTFQVAYLSPRSSTAGNSTELDRQTATTNEQNQQRPPGIRGFLAKAYRDAIGQALTVVVGTGLLIFLLNLVIVAIIALRSAQARRRIVHDTSSTANGGLANNRDVSHCRKPTLKNSSPSSNQSVSVVSKQLKFNLPNSIGESEQVNYEPSTGGRREQMQQQVMLISHDPRGFLENENSYSTSNQSPMQLQTPEQVQLASSFGYANQEFASPLSDEPQSGNHWPDTSDEMLVPRRHQHHPSCVNSRSNTTNSSTYSNTVNRQPDGYLQHTHRRHHHHHHNHQEQREGGLHCMSNQDGCQQVQFSHSSLSPSSSTNISTTPVPMETFAINNVAPFQLEPIGLIYDSNQLLVHQHQLAEADKMTLIATPNPQSAYHLQPHQAQHYR